MLVRHFCTLLIFLADCCISNLLISICINVSTESLIYEIMIRKILVAMVVG